MPISPLNLANQPNRQAQSLSCATSSSQTLPLQMSCLQTVTTDNAKLMRVTHILVAIGSNHNATVHIPFAKKELMKLSRPFKASQQNFSAEYTNPDYTASSENPKPDYTNLCAEVELHSAMTVADIIVMLKSIEARCLRHQHHCETIKSVESNDIYHNVKPVDSTTDNPVTLDLDLLAIIIESDDNFDRMEWVIIKERLPFKGHEKIGMQELALFK